jgi:hypothetical protein
MKRISLALHLRCCTYPLNRPELLLAHTVSCWAGTHCAAPLHTAVSSTVTTQLNCLAQQQLQATYYFSMQYSALHACIKQ